MPVRNFLLLLCITTGSLIQAQITTPLKQYSVTVAAGHVNMVYEWGETNGNYSDKVFTVSSRYGDGTSMYLKALGNRLRGDKLFLYVNGAPVTTFYPEIEGWQWLGKELPAIKLQNGKNEIRFRSYGISVPMVEEIDLTIDDPWRRQAAVPDAGDEFLNYADRLRQQPVGTFRSAAEVGDLTEKVLPNPEGYYSHYVDTNFTYSHFSWLYLTAGSHTFTTSSSTIDRALTIFNPTNYTYSWSNVNGGPGGESGLYLYVGLSGYYAITLRPVIDGQTGVTNIIHNGNTLVPNAIIGGRRIAMSTLRGGAMNHFTCKLTGSNPDTRMLVSWYAMSSARGYNDDYAATGDWNWGLSSRIKKDFNGQDSVQYGFVCAFSPTSTGTCDMYMGTRNSNLHNAEPQNFPLLDNDDAIETGNTGYYNCISWSGGVTTSWIWPLSAMSTYNCTNANPVQCFDNFYSNNPVRYPGAWNYTRTGATVSNAVVDLWKRPGGAYQHGSVRKPGNNHPHGYDWESKPGGLNRTLHPRNALEQVNWYGVVSDYYKPTGTYARNSEAQYNFETDADAIKAGVAIYDKGMLTAKADDKLSRLFDKVNASVKIRFEELYKTWDATKAANASLSDPSMYCQNNEFKAMQALAMKYPKEVMILVFDKFVNKNDHFIGDLLITLAKDKYSHLLDEVKADRLAHPNDEQGRYRIHGDHDNGVLYVEKILKDFELDEITPAVSDAIQITVSPNPVRDMLQIKVQLKESSEVSVNVTSTQTLKNRLVQKTTTLPAGLQQFSVPVAAITGTTGDVLSVQVTVNGITKSVKVLVNK